MRWYEFISPAGPIDVKAGNEAEARMEAAERKGCGTEELICIGHKPFWQPGIPPPPRIGRK